MASKLERRAARTRVTDGMNPPQKIGVKKDLRQIFDETRVKVTAESQVLKDRVEI